MHEGSQNYNEAKRVSGRGFHTSQSVCLVYFSACESQYQMLHFIPWSNIMA